MTEDQKNRAAHAALDRMPMGTGFGPLSPEQLEVWSKATHHPTNGIQPGVKPMHVMLDIETLGVSGARDFVITQIAMVAFDPCDPPPAVYNSTEARYEYARTMLPSLKCTLDIGEQQLAGAQIEAQTLHWWLTENPQTLRSTLDDPRGVVSVLDEIRRFLQAMETTHLWGNGNTFDNMALRNLFCRHGVEFPLHFARDMDLRTIRWAAGLDRASGVLVVADHDPLVDCCKQIVDLWQYMEVLGRREHGTKA